MQAGYRMDLSEAAKDLKFPKYRSKAARDLKIKLKNNAIDRAVYGSDFKDKDIDTSEVLATGEVEDKKKEQDQSKREALPPSEQSKREALPPSEQLGLLTDINRSNLLTSSENRNDIPPNSYEDAISGKRTLLPNMTDYYTQRQQIQEEPKREKIVSFNLAPKVKSIKTQTDRPFVPPALPVSVFSSANPLEVSKNQSQSLLTNLNESKDLIQKTQSIIDEIDAKDKPDRDIVSETKTELEPNMTADMKTKLESIEINPSEEFKTPIESDIVDSEKKINETKTKLQDWDSHVKGSDFVKETAFNINSDIIQTEARQLLNDYNQQAISKNAIIGSNDIRSTDSRTIPLFKWGETTPVLNHKLMVKRISRDPRKIEFQVRNISIKNVKKDYDIRRSILIERLRLLNDEVRGRKISETGRHFTGNGLSGFGIEGTEKPVHWSNKDEDVDNSVSLPHFKNGTFVFNPLGKPHKPLQLRNPSKAFMDIVKDIVDRDTFNATDYKKIKAAHEQKILLKFMKVANPIVPKGIKIDEINVGDLQLLRKRYQVLLGELVAGNQGEAVKSEMIKILQTLKKTRNMNPAKVDDLIQGLNEL